KMFRPLLIGFVDGKRRQQTHLIMIALAYVTFSGTGFFDTVEQAEK
ncbi:MAG: hypothetical protein GX978_08505, partial [Tissierellia bacterium]|nr:hypothetical protein [Tissierellia bacterium]